MKLSIYVGLRAIAWLVTEENNIIDRGVKVVNVPFDNYYEYIAGQPVSLRISRREKRQARRNLWRYKSRRANLKFFLKQNGIFGKKKLHRNQILQLRVKGLSEQLSPEELYIVLLSLQFKRGYKSLRGVSDNENSEYLQTIAMHEENRLKFKSIADYLLSLDTSKNIIFNRTSYEEEFWQIMAKQNISDELKNKIFHYIYFQRPLKKGTVGKCKYEEKRDVAHASNPIYQEFRCWRDVNNIIVWDEMMEEIEIPLRFRRIWFEKLNTGRKITKASVCKDLGIKNAKEYSWLSGKELAGNPVAGIPFELWQDLFSATENQKLRELLIKKYNYSEIEIERLIDLDLHKLGYSDISTKAIYRLMPYLINGMKLSEAVLQEYGKVEMKNIALRNVVLEKHFDAYQSLIEALKQKYTINEIKFEIDQLLKAGNKQRKEMAKRQRANIKFEKENQDVLAGRTDYDKLKYKLWKESDGISPYQPDYIIPIEELFSTKYNIDHIVPKSKIFETGYANMILSPTSLNEEKGQIMPYQFATENLGFSEEYWKEIAEKFGSKKQFLLMQEPPTDWISKRQNSDYNTKCFATLATLNIPNKLINKFANEWKLNQFSSDDCRYYMQKALVLANLDEMVIDRYDHIAVIDKKVYHLEQKIKATPDFLEFIPFRRNEKLTRKTKFGYYPAKQLHQETILGKRTIEGKTFFKVRQPLTKLSNRMLQNIYAIDLQKELIKWVEEKGGLEKAIASLEETPFFFRGNPVTAISVRMTDTELPFLHHKAHDGTIHNKNKVGKPVSFVYPENNYALSVWEENGKQKKRLITLLEHCKNLNTGKVEYQGTLFRKFDTVRYRGVLMYLIGCGESNQLRNAYHLNASETIRHFKYSELEKIFVNQLGKV